MQSIYAKNPCRHCKPPARYPGCHGECEKRAEWIGELREAQNQVYAQRNKERKLDQFTKDNIVKTLKRIGKEK